MFFTVILIFYVDICFESMFTNKERLAFVILLWTSVLRFIMKENCGLVSIILKVVILVRSFINSSQMSLKLNYSYLFSVIQMIFYSLTNCKFASLLLSRYHL
jgi:hypothetical protein